MILDFAGGKVTVMLVDELPADRKFVFYRGEAYRRILTGDHRISESEIEKQEEFREEALQARELQIVPGVTLAGLELDKLNDYITQLNRPVKIETVKPDLDSALPFLERKSFIKDGRVTTLGVLVCGQHAADLLGFRCQVHGYVDVPQEIARDKQDFADNVLPLMEGSLAYLLRNIQIGVSVAQGGSNRPQYPEQLLRETVNNALAHRDYSINRLVVVSRCARGSILSFSSSTAARLWSIVRAYEFFAQVVAAHMKKVTRRTCLKQMALTAAASLLPALSRPLPVFAMEAVFQEPTPTEREAAAIAAIAQQYMTKYNAPGLSVAVARHGQFVYQQGFGYADKAAGERVTPASLFRIASVTKPVTSAAIFSLIEQGRLGLDDLIFGAPGLLKFDYGKDYPESVKKITLRHLLTHTCGGWENNGRDPMFSRPEMNHQELITWAVHNLPLQYAPGAHYAYSNFGYCILGRVIEKITGQPYADFVQQTVLAKCGIKDMRLAGNTLAQRASGEVVYYGQAGAGTNPYNMNVTRMDSHGGWIATPGDLVQFAMHVDGFDSTPNILGANTLKTMTTASAANPHYACGWLVNEIPNWWHTGGLPGTLTILVRTASRLCWAAFTNTRANGFNLDEMLWKMVQAVPAWRA